MKTIDIITDKDFENEEEICFDDIKDIRINGKKITEAF